MTAVAEATPAPAKTASQLREQAKFYRPVGGADALWRCKDAEVLMDGPAGTGKTRAILEKLNLQAMKYPGARILICRKTRASCTESVLVTFEDHVLTPRSSVKDGAKRAQRWSYYYPNESIIVVGGLDNVDRIMSTEYDVIYVNEATEISLHEWETLLTRLRHGRMPYMQAIACCNPANPKHWLKARADAGRMTRIISRHDDNPTLTKDYLERLSRLTGVRRERLYQGNWAAAEGLVYDGFRESLHVKEVNRNDWSFKVMSIDEGYSNPCAMHVYGVDNDGRVHVLAEWFERGKLERQVVDQAKAFCREHDIDAIVVDPSAAGLIACLQAEDLPAQEAINDVFPGIRTVQDMLDVAGDGKPRLTFDPNCKGMLDEMVSYVWARNRDGGYEDKPEKKNDHAMDGLRYACAYVAEIRGNSDNMDVMVI